MTEFDLSLLQKTDLFSKLNQNDVRFVSSHTEVINLPKGKLLFSAGEKAARFYILINGEIRVFKKIDDSNSKESMREEDMAQFTSGDTIGDFDFARGAEYDAFAEANTDSQLIVFPNADQTLDSLAIEEPQIICNILISAIVMMTARIKSTNKLLLNNMSWVQDLHRRAYEDAGTGLWKQTLIADEIIGSLKDKAALIMLKPDRFKILVDSRGHSAGDEAMIKIALILKNICRRIGNGWALRFKSNEVGLIFNNCDAQQAKEIAELLASEIACMEEVPAIEGENKIEVFHFSATISWCIWPFDGSEWMALFQGNYANLLETCKAGGNTIVHFSPKEKGKL
ncbi:MAG: diguanylate cyclase [Treponema sp.]|nr:diguanylate cyclase [Treponema sp.]MCL2250799.1 diguanylate cyclase [Treponema sp.]